jgi:hypothetical protein
MKSTTQLLMLAAPSVFADDVDLAKQLAKIGDQPGQFSAGLRYYAAKPDNGSDWGLRFGMTFLFPKS